MLDYENAYNNAESLLHIFETILDYIDEYEAQSTILVASYDLPKTRFESIVKNYFKDLTLEKFLNTYYTAAWFSEFEDECLFSIGLIDRSHVSRAYHKVGPLAASYWL